MSKGYYLMHRGWEDHDAFAPEPYTEREAWEWLIREAAYMPHPIRAGRSYEMILLERGDVPASLRTLAEQWKWSVKRVRSFLTHLEKLSMISKKRGTPFTVITVCNYNKYQIDINESGTPSTTAGKQQGHNHNKGKKKEKKEPPISPIKKNGGNGDWYYNHLKKQQAEGAFIDNKGREYIREYEKQLAQGEQHGG